MSPINQPDEPRTGRYDQARIAAEVTRVIQRRKRGTHVAVARALNMSSQQLTHRCSNDYDFTIEQLGIIADFLRAPTGWPFIEWHEAEDRDEAYRNRRRRQ